MDSATISDVYAGCGDGCTHDLARGCLTGELIERDGPFPPDYPSGNIPAVLIPLLNRLNLTPRR